MARKEVKWKEECYQLRNEIHEVQTTNSDADNSCQNRAFSHNEDDGDLESSTLSAEHLGEIQVRKWLDPINSEESLDIRKSCVLEDKREHSKVELPALQSFAVYITKATQTTSCTLSISEGLQVTIRPEMSFEKNSEVKVQDCESQTTFDSIMDHKVLAIMLWDKVAVKVKVHYATR